MAVETLIPNTFEGLAKGIIGVIAALGGVIFLYLVFSIINFYINRKRLNVLSRMDRKLDIILSIINKKQNK